MQNLIEGLIHLGFTEYEAKAYVALVKLGPASGYQVAKESGMPRSTIYETLGKLGARGAVLTQTLGAQARYTAVPPERLLGRLEREFNEHRESLLQGLQQLSSAAEPRVGAWTMAGREVLFSQARQMIELAAKSVALLVGDDDELDRLLPSLQLARENGVRLTVLSPTPYDGGKVPVMVHPDGPRLRQATGHGFCLVIDGSEALIGEVDRSESAVWTSNSYLIHLLEWEFDHVMASARKRRP